MNGPNNRGRVVGMRGSRRIALIAVFGDHPSTGLHGDPRLLIRGLVRMGVPDESRQRNDPGMDSLVCASSPNNPFKGRNIALHLHIARPIHTEDHRSVVQCLTRRIEL